MRALPIMGLFLPHYLPIHWPSCSSPEPYDVLARQPGNKAIEREPLGFNLGSRIGDTHPVGVSDRDAGIFLAVLDQDQRSVGLERPADAPEHFLGTPELVIHVDEQREVNGVFRKV